MAERIDDIISKEAFDQVAKMDKGLSELLKRFEGNANAVKLFNAALQGSDKMSQVTATIKQAATETAKLEAAQRQLAFANSEQGKELALLKVQIEENTRANKNAAKEMLATEGSVKQMNAQLIRLRGQWDNMSEALRKSPMGAELAKRINLVDTALKTLDSNTGRFQRNVGNYATATNSLSQVLREMPAFTYSVQTGILGISNNLPILIDQFNNTARAVNETTGKINGAGGALKIFASSLLSFPNILTVAIGLFTIFSDKIFKSSKATDSANKSLQDYEKTLEKVNERLNESNKYIDRGTDLLLSQARARGATSQELAAIEISALNDRNKAIDYELTQVGEQMANYERLVSLKKAGSAVIEKSEIELQETVDKLQGEYQALIQKRLDNSVRMEVIKNNQIAELNKKSNKDLETQAKAHVKEMNNILKDQQRVGMDNLPGDALAGAGAGSNLGWLSALTVTPGSPEEEELDKSAETIKKYFKKLTDDMAAVFDGLDREKILGIEDTTDATKLAQEIQTEAERKGAAERKKIKKEEERQKRIIVLENTAQLVQMAAEIMSIAADIDFQREMSQIENRDKALTESHDKELKAIELSGKSKAQQEIDKRRLEAQTEAQRKRIDRDRIAAARKKARADKAADIANIITSTAVAVVNALKSFPPPANLAMAAFTGAIGLANLARAAAAPLPQFAKGTNSAPGGLAVVSERGQELVIEPSGKKYLTPATESIINLPKGSKVIPNDELMKSVEQATMIKLGQGGAVTSQQYGDVMVEIFEQTLEENRKLRRVLEDKKMSVVINNNSEFDNWTKKYVK
jgi:hypothetical protein